MNSVAWLVQVEHAADDALALSIMSPLPGRKEVFTRFGQAVLPARAKAMARVALCAKALYALEGNTDPGDLMEHQIQKARVDLASAVEALNAVA